MKGKHVKVFVKFKIQRVTMNNVQIVGRKVKDNGDDLHI